MPDLPPKDGSVLQTVYDDEIRYMRRMRSGEAEPTYYIWCPETSLSVSTREAARLGRYADFAAEPVAIRSTGGTAVPQGPGTLNISVLSKHPRHPGIHETYQAVCSALMEGFAKMGLETTIGARPGSFCDGDFNLLHDGRKLVGTAQRWALAPDGSALCLHHCVILSGGRVDSLCARTEALYAHCGIETHYDRGAHSGLAIDRETLSNAMKAPLHAFLEKAAHDEI